MRRCEIEDNVLLNSHLSEIRTNSYIIRFSGAIFREFYFHNMSFFTITTNEKNILHTIADFPFFFARL